MQPLRERTLRRYLARKSSAEASGREDLSAVEIYPGNFSRRGLGTIPPEDLMRFTGRELLQRLVDGTYPAPPICGLLNFTLTEVHEGRVVFRGVPSDKLLNPLGGVHGGWAATLLDSSMFCAVQTLLEKGEVATTAEFKVNLIRPITPKTGEVVCEGRVVNKGRTLAVSEATLKDLNGKLLAFASETCLIFPIANPASR
jgi:uncharacterized protein (TIGR00369 family)